MGSEKPAAGKAPPKKLHMPKYMNFIIGGTSGMMAICVVQPADLLKTRMQLLGKHEKHMTFFTVAKNIVKHEGVLGFYVGLSAALFRQATYGTGRLGAFNGLFDFYKARYGVPTFPIKIVMGMGAGAFGAYIGTPAEVALIRMTADGRLPPEKKRNYKNVFNALARITREEGITTLWRGASATVSRAMVVNGAQLGSYSQAREMLLPYMGDNLPLHAVAAMIAGFITTVASLPVDIVKTRVQNSAEGLGQIQILKNVIKNEGVLTLWSGLMPTYAKLGPMTILIFVFLEQLNKLYYKAREMLLPYMGDGLPLHAVAAMIAGFITTVASLPVDIVKTRVQNSEEGLGQIQILKNVIKNEGVLTLWSGLMPTYAKIGPMTILIFVFLEQLNKLYYKVTGQI